jgi:hypothetical protein
MKPDKEVTAFIPPSIRMKRPGQSLSASIKSSKAPTINKPSTASTSISSNSSNTTTTASVAVDDIYASFMDEINSLVN